MGITANEGVVSALERREMEQSNTSSWAARSIMVFSVTAVARLICCRVSPRRVSVSVSVSLQLSQEGPVWMLSRHRETRGLVLAIFEISAKIKFSIFFFPPPAGARYADWPPSDPLVERMWPMPGICGQKFCFSSKLEVLNRPRRNTDTPEMFVFFCHRVRLRLVRCVLPELYPTTQRMSRLRSQTCCFFRVAYTARSFGQELVSFGRVAYVSSLSVFVTDGSHENCPI